jgi:hypothetical protein
MGRIGDYDDTSGRSPFGNRLKGIEWLIVGRQMWSSNHAIKRRVIDMRSWRAFVSALVLFQMTGPASFAIVAVPPEIVGPPFYMASVDCPSQIARPGGTKMGAAIPVPALRLGSSVQRAKVSFGTGGGGTSNAAELARRKSLGLPITPKTFDVAGSALPQVYTPEAAVSASGFYPYQRLPLKTASKGYWPNGLIYAQPTSATTGRIAALVLTLSTPPAARAKLRITTARKTSEGVCQRQPSIDVFAPAMSADQLGRLFSPSGCNWRQLASCKPTEWPRGQILFVQQSRSGVGYEHRWVDYDMLAAAHFGRRTSVHR